MKLRVSLHLLDDNDEVITSETGTLDNVEKLNTLDLVGSIRQWVSEKWCKMLVSTVRK